jgi:hypothetical protein
LARGVPEGHALHAARNENVRPFFVSHLSPP